MKVNIYILLLLLFSLSLCSDEDKINYMKNLYGENKEITGEYDKNLSVTCNNGIFVGIKKGNVLSFKGIPYAQPPIGNLRWKEPVQAQDSNKVYQAYYFGKSPIQSESLSQLGSYYPQGEGCLYLNVWINTNDPSNNKTVMVFIHGGGYNSGSTSEPLYDGNNLIEKYKDIIYVSIEYRLGIFGFIDFSSVPGGENYKTSNNMGLLDQICALKWIQKNIKNFGGDPQRITLFGQSAGATSISLLTLMDESENLFQRIICESGSFGLTSSTEESQILTKKFLEKSGASKMEDLLSLSEEQIKKINDDIASYDHFAERDGNILPKDLYEAFKSRKTKNIDMLLGSNKDEIRFFINSMGKFFYTHGLPILFENNLKKISEEDKKYVEDFMKLQNDKKIWKITEFYNEAIFRVPMNKQAEYHSDAGGNTYVYYWKYGKDELLKAYHSIELLYVFNNFNETSSQNKINQELSSKVQDMWVNFARNGNPSTNDIIWEKYNSSTRKTMYFDEKIEMGEEYKSEQRELIEPLLKYYFNGNSAEMSYNVPQTYRIAAQFLGAIGIVIASIVFTIKLK